MKPVLLSALLWSSIFAPFPTNAIAQTCSVSASQGARDPDFVLGATEDGPGNNREPIGLAGWTGADSTYSTLLPNGDSAFFFSDSYIGQWPAAKGDGTVSTNADGLRTRVENCGPPYCNPPTNLYHAHNSIVVYQPTTGNLYTLTGPKVSGYSSSYFVPTNKSDFFWMGESVVVPLNRNGTKKVWTFLMEWDSSIDFQGTSIAQLSLPDLKIESINPLQNVPANAVVHWGVAAWLDDDQGSPVLYIYGIEDNGQKGRFPFIAMVNPILGLSGVVDTNNWSVWNGTGWVKGLNNAVQIIGAPGDPNNAGDYVSSEYSVKKVESNAGTTYLLVAQDTKPPVNQWKDIVLYSACQPQGPFSAKQVVYSTPQTGAKKVPGMEEGQTLAGMILTYNPHAHPQFNHDGSLLISYNLNASNSGDLLFADTYRPVFIRVKIDGLK
jgi:hypothetical protein